MGLDEDFLADDESQSPLFLSSGVGNSPDREVSSPVSSPKPSSEPINVGNKWTECLKCGTEDKAEREYCTNCGASKAVMKRSESYQGQVIKETWLQSFEITRYPNGDSFFRSLWAKKQGQEYKVKKQEVQKKIAQPKVEIGKVEEY